MHDRDQVSEMDLYQPCANKDNFMNHFFICKYHLSLQCYCSFLVRNYYAKLKVIFSGNAKTNILKKATFNLTRLLQKVSRKLFYLDSICLPTDQFGNKKNLFSNSYT